MFRRLPDFAGLHIAYFLLFAIFVAMSSDSAWGQTALRTFPYKARISADDVYVRSGPGRNYYPTDKLRAGQEVEVYRHDPGGWYAIRPPKGSFAWVSSRFVKYGRDGLAEVTGERVAARVGSRFSDIRDVIQVRLHEGEVVEPLPSAKSDPAASTQDSTKWTKILPPSGEFRWVHEKFVDPNYETSGIRKTSSNNSPLVPYREQELSSRHAHQQSRAGVVSGDELPNIPADGFKKWLDDVDLELSVMVAEEPSVWQFDDLRLEAESLVNHAETALQRGRARIMLGKIDRFAEIKKRYDAVNTLWDDTQSRNQQLAGIGGQHNLNRTQAGVAFGENSDRFDGRGRLTRVVSPKKGAPRYALLNESGGVECYVTPAPGVNLRHYEQRIIGVNGARGYVPEQRAQHIMAQHVDLIDGTKVR